MPELTDSEDLRQRIIEESKEYILRPPQNGEFTRRDFMEANDITYESSKTVLKKMEGDGKIYSRKGVNENGKCLVYGWIED